MRAYHDDEWGVPQRDDRRLFEHLILDQFQAGLSWSVILRKRQAFRSAFDGFDAQAIARYHDREVERLLGDSGIVRNRSKIEATIHNARLFLDLQRDSPGFSRYIWGFVDGAPIQNRWRVADEVPSRTEESERMSRDLKARGWRFVGPTICYAFMQAAGLVNDHLVDCHRHDAVRRLAPDP